MLVYAQSGNTINLGGGIGNRQNNVSVGNGYLYVNNDGDPAAFTVNVFPFTTVSASSYTPDAIIASKSTSNTAGTLLLHSTDLSVVSGQVLGVLQFGGRGDSGNSYISSQIIGEVKNGPGSGNAGGGVLKFQTGPYSTGSQPSTRMVIGPAGNIGIGTGNVIPGNKLEVAGDSYFKGEAAFAKTGNPGTSSMLHMKPAGGTNGDALIEIGDVDNYWSGGVSRWDTGNATLVHGLKVGINRTPTEMLHLWKGSLFLEDSGIRDATGDYGAAGQNLKSKGQDVVQWSWEKQTLISTFYASSSNQQSGTVIYMPVGGTVGETNSSQYYNNFVAPYDGRVRHIRIKNITGTPTATGFASFRVYVNGSNVSSQAPTVTNGGSNGMMGTYTFDDTDATFSAGDRVQFAYVASGSTGYMFGSSATFIIEYTTNK